MDRGFDWTHMRAFLATAETGSLSAAARQLAVTQPTVGRQVAALEQELRLALFERTARAMTLTDAGRDLLVEARRMGDAAQRISVIAQGRTDGLDGTIRVTASDMMSAYVLPDTLLKLRSIAPRLRVDVVAANDIRDILKREADIAIRHVRPTEPDLIARKISDASAHLYASKDYVTRRGMPATVEDLKEHDFISMADDDLFIAAMADRGIPVTRDNLRAGSTSGITTWEMMRKGFGLFPMSDHIAEQFDDALRLLDGVTDLTFPVWLVTHRDLHTSKRIRLVFDLLTDMLSES
ncbi:LysR family transcriptional regulator [Tateyamaria omphalii]|uniref:LysR family transcriptional regulator n=1 Tax=Tateyamaria omphalii TaxID=299262 RepID=A0A1P8MXC9_9RHOB|nr:LysR family transcriptional regulator [Tateyamaria omphalii]APX12747.1 LysR family transcriptional regulator [Tateyamaria omphalii]